MEKGIRAAAAKAGVDLTVAEYPKAWGPENQIPILQATYAAGKFDLLLIAPTSTDALKAPLKAIYDKGIEIITVDTYIGDGDYSKAGTDYGFPLSYIGSDNYPRRQADGRAAGQDGRREGQGLHARPRTPTPPPSSTA